jgi:hypothetical protein
MPDYVHILKPSIAYLENCGRLLIDIQGMAEFLGIPAKAVQQMTWTRRIPVPMRVGGTVRWSVISLARWVEAGCPR